MTNENPKTKAGLFIKNVLKPILRASFKQIPIIGPPITEIVTNLTTPKGEKKKHTNLSIGFQIGIAVVVILDIVLNKGANLLALVDLIGLLPTQEVPEISPSI